MSKEREQYEQPEAEWHPEYISPDVYFTPEQIAIRALVDRMDKYLLPFHEEESDEG